jgi:hypothetical protein
MNNELQHLSAGHFVTLILDNEVTVGEFVTAPPIPWTRLAHKNGTFEVADGSPGVLTAAHAKFEMKNWDEVSWPAIAQALNTLEGSVDYLLFGNNAGQGLPLAQSLAPSLIADHAAIIYANSLPEKSAYERFGYRVFFRRSEAIGRLLALSKNSGKPLALCFINTIQHNELNYHDA